MKAISCPYFPLKNLEKLAEFSSGLSDVFVGKMMSGTLIRSIRFSELNYVVMLQELEYYDIVSRVPEININPIAIWRPKSIRQDSRFKKSNYKIQSFMGMTLNLKEFNDKKGGAIDSFDLVDILELDDDKHLDRFDHPCFGSHKTKRFYLRKELSQLYPRKMWHFIVLRKYNIVASITLFLDEEVCGIYDFAVAEGHCGQNAGFDLMSQSLYFAKDNNCRLAVVQSFVGSIGFYEKVGFVPLQSIECISPLNDRPSGLN